MLYLIIFAVSIVAAAIVLVIDFGPEDIGEWVIVVLLGALLGALIGALLSIIVGAASSSLPTEKTLVGNSKVRALQDNGTTTGHFFFGSGYVDGEMRYTYMEDVGNGGMQMKQISTEGAVIVESGEPRIETYRETYKSALARKLLGDSTFFAEDSYVIYAPPGTVAQQFNVDLK